MPCDSPLTGRVDWTERLEGVARLELCCVLGPVQCPSVEMDGGKQNILVSYCSGMSEIILLPHSSSRSRNCLVTQYPVGLFLFAKTTLEISGHFTESVY